MSSRLPIMGAAASLATLLTFGAGPARAEVDWNEGRKREAVEMCRDYAEELLEDRTERRRDLRIGNILKADERDDKIEVQGWVRTEGGRDERRRAWINCRVDFDGEDRVTDFREDSFFASWRESADDDRDWERDRDWDWERDRGRRRDRDRRGDLRGDANDACRELVRDQGYDVADVQDRDRTENGMRLDMRLRRNDRRWDAVCQYNGNQDEARLVRLDPERR